MNSFDQGSAWKDLTAQVINGNGANNNWPNPGRIRFGGWSNALNETSKGEVSAFLLFNTELSDADRRDIEFYLANKWNMTDQLEFDFNRKLKFTEGSDFYSIQLTDQNNYQNSLTLFTGIFQAKEVGSYQWELLNISEQAAFWLDKNQNGYFEEDERILRYKGENQSNVLIDSIELSEGNYSLAIYHAVTSATPSLEVRFATPTSASGPPSLTTIHPSAQNQNELFQTSNLASLVRRGPLQLGLTGDGTLSFRYINKDNILLIQSDQAVNQANWSQVGVSVNEQNSSIELFINGQVVKSEELPEGLAADLSDSLFWNVGGNHPLEHDNFFGKIDDLRFYKTALSEEQILEIYNDDITGRPIVGSRKQVIFDEGNERNGILLVNDEGRLRAQVIENENFTEVSTTKLIEDTSNELPFTPLQEQSWDLKVWLDAADLESMDQGNAPGAVGPPNDGNTVGYWRDKSGNGFHAVRAAGSPKYRNAGLDGGFPSIETGNAYFDLTNTNNAFDALDQLSVMFVHKWSGLDTWDSMVWKGSGRGWGFVGTFCIGKMNLGHSQGLGVWYYDGVSGRTKQHGGALSYADQKPQIYTLVKGYGGSNSNSYIWSNGTLTSSTNNVYTTLPSSLLHPVRIGDFNNGTSNQYSELLMFTKAINDEERQIFEGYLAHKWGLNGDIPFTHPYFSTPHQDPQPLKKPTKLTQIGIILL